MKTIRALFKLQCHAKMTWSFSATSVRNFAIILGVGLRACLRVSSQLVWQSYFAVEPASCDGASFSCSRSENTPFLFDIKKNNNSNSRTECHDSRSFHKLKNFAPKPSLRVTLNVEVTVGLECVHVHPLDSIIKAWFCGLFTCVFVRVLETRQAWYSQYLIFLFLWLMTEMSFNLSFSVSHHAVFCLS